MLTDYIKIKNLKIVLYIIVLSVITISLINFIINRDEKAYIERKKEDLSALATELSIVSLNKISSAVEILSQFQSVKDVITHKSKPDNPLIDAVLTSNKNLLNASIIYVIDSTGTVVSCVEYSGKERLTGNNYKFRSYFSRAMKGETVVSPALGVTTNERGLYFSTPVKDEKNTIVGVFVIKYGLKEIDDLINAESNPMALTVSNDIVFATNVKKWMYKSTRYLSKEKIALIEKSKQFSNKKITSLPFQINSSHAIIENEKYGVLKKNLGYTDWNLVLFYPEPKVPVAEIIILLIIFSAIAIISILYINSKTKNILSEKSVKDSARRLSAFSKVIGESIFFSDKGIFIEANESATKMFGYSFDEIIGKSATDFFAQESRELVKKNMLSGYKKPYDALAIKKDGSKFWCEIHGRNFNYQDKDIRVTSIIDITKRKQAEETLRESEEKFRSLFENSTEFLFTLDLNGNFTDVNKAAETLTGFTKAELLKKNFKDYIPKTDHRKLLLLFNQLYNTGDPINDIFIEAKMKDNSTKYFLIGLSLLIEKNEIIGFQGTSTDITERKTATEEIETFWEVSPDLICVADYTTAVFLRINPAFTKTLGYEKSELLNRSFMEFVHPDDVQSTIDVIDKKLKVGKHVFDFTNRYRCKDGSYKYLDWVSHSIKEKGLTYAIARDVTSQIEAEEKIIKAKETAERYLDMAGSMFVSLDINGNILLVNQRALEILEYDSSEELIGKNWFDTCIPQEINSDVKQVFNKVMTGEIEGVVHYENEIVTKSGDRKIISWYNSYIKDEAGKTLHLLSSGIDVTEIRKVLEENEKTKTQLQQAQKMEAIGTLAGGIAHDFNNLLTVIIGYTAMALKNITHGSDLHEYLDEVLTASNRAKDLVKQILAYSRQNQVERSSLQLQPLVKEALKLLRSSIPTTISITEDIDPNSKNIMADPTQIHQIMVNLCTNAYHAMETTGGTISVSLHMTFISPDDRKMLFHLRPGEYVELTISDNGKGISPDVIDKIFDPYFTTKEVGKGTGMGLAIIHGIVNEYGGTITVESELGKGSTFHVFFPVVQTDAELNIKEHVEIPVGTERILFVDDEKNLLKMGQRMLEALGYHVTALNSSVDALATFEKSPMDFDLVISDQTMPDITGSDLAGRMMQIRPGIPIILVTGYSSLINEDSAKNLGIKGFALKPFSQSKIAKLIRKVLSGLD